MPDILQKELEFLLQLPTGDLVKELEACRERWQVAQAEKQAKAAAAAAAPPPPPPVAATVAKQRSRFIKEFLPDTVSGLEGYVDTIYTNVMALRGLFDLYPAVDGLAELAVSIDNEEPCMASELIILAATGDVTDEQGVQIDAKQLKQILGDAKPRPPK